METKDALRWGAIYTALWVAAGLAGLAVAAAGALIGALAGTSYAPLARPYLLTAPHPYAGRALVVLGVLVWQFGSAAAFFKTVTTALRYETARQLDTEALKSDILSVLDERLSEMQGELNQTRRMVDRMSRDDAASDFEFQDSDL